MERTLLQRLLAWKDKPQRKPLLIDGTRQTGKTYLLKELLGKHFNHVVHIDFRAEPKYCEIFADSLMPSDVIRKLELMTNEHFDAQSDLLILDNIDACEQALTALKYFAQEAPESYVAAACSHFTANGGQRGKSSNVAMSRSSCSAQSYRFMQSFPVGKVELYTLRPMSFREFLHASNCKVLIEYFDKQQSSACGHQSLWEQFLDYLFTGGMPAAVAAWFENQSTSILDRIAAVHAVHSHIMGHIRTDLSRSIPQLELFESIPLQLAQDPIQSVSRFMFNQVSPSKKRYSSYADAIQHLTSCGLILPNYILNPAQKGSVGASSKQDGSAGTASKQKGSAGASSKQERTLSRKDEYMSVHPCSSWRELEELQPPLVAYKKSNMLKLFMCDVGLLNFMTGVSYKEIHEQQSDVMGYLAESFVQQELAALGQSPTYSYAHNCSQIEFLLTSDQGDVVPVEVKSMRRTKAKSLATYLKRYHPSQSIRLAATHCPANAAQSHITMPLYYACYLPAFLSRS